MSSQHHMAVQILTKLAVRGVHLSADDYAYAVQLIVCALVHERLDTTRELTRVAEGILLSAATVGGEP